MDTPLFRDSMTRSRINESALEHSDHRTVLRACPGLTVRLRVSVDWSASILKWLPRTHHMRVPILSIVSSRPHTTTSSLNLESKYFPETFMKSCLRPSLQSKALCSNGVALHFTQETDHFRTALIKNQEGERGGLQIFTQQVPPLAHKEGSPCLCWTSEGASPPPVSPVHQQSS